MYKKIVIISLCSITIPFFTEAANPCPFIWSRNMSIGTKGEDVRTLQEFLNENISDESYKISTSGYYGLITKKAVSEFQEKNRQSTVGINNTGLGSVGPKTRFLLNSLCSQITHLPVALKDTGVVEIRKVVIPESTIPAGVLRVPFTKVQIKTNKQPVTIDAMTIERGGMAHDGIFESVVILDIDGNPISDEKVLNSEHRATIPLDLTIDPMQEIDIIIAGNITDTTDDYTGQRPQLNIVSIKSSIPLNNAIFPIIGDAHTIISNITVGSFGVALSGDDPMTSRDVYINDTTMNFGGIRVTANSIEDLQLQSITWEQVGTASIDDIGDVEVVADGRRFLATRDGREYTATLDDVFLKKGMSTNITILGAIRGSGAGRTVKFDIGGSDAIVARGMSYKFFVNGSATSNTNTTGNSVFLTTDGTPDGDALEPFFSGSVFSIHAGIFTSITK